MRSQLWARAAGPAQVWHVCARHTHTHTLAALALSSALFDLAHSRGLFGRRFHLGIPALLGQGSLWLNLTSSFGPTAKSCKNRFIELLQNSNKDCVKTCRGTARGNA